MDVLELRELILKALNNYGLSSPRFTQEEISMLLAVDVYLEVMK